MNIYHKHHIIPKHMGGTDDPSNLIELTIEEHAEAHRKLFEFSQNLLVRRLSNLPSEEFREKQHTVELEGFECP